MASIELDNVSLTFTVRQASRLTFKEYLLKLMFLESRNPIARVPALVNMNFRASDGERIGVIGHNGAGKSTLLKMLAGVYPPTSGTRKVTGRICSLFDITLGFESEASGRDNIRYRAYLQGETPRTLARKQKEIEEFCELKDFLDTPVRYYSAGMAVRLAFSIATATDPEVLLIDEVLGVGDMAFQLKARERMKELMANARLMVMVSHDLESIQRMCTRVVWLGEGRILMDGDPATVCNAYTNFVTRSRAEAPALAAA
jgi:ABC-type polysaccharide/polyol phosphate transport system ATPase subunit